MGHEQLDTLATAASTTPPAGAKYALISASTQSVRFRDDGTAPTAAIGIVITAADAPFWYSGNLHALQFIEITASAAVDIAYYS
jgi:hypothetical protein